MRQQCRSPRSKKVWFQKRFEEEDEEFFLVSGSVSKRATREGEGKYLKGFKAIAEGTWLMWKVDSVLIEVGDAC
jgi:hypothetical protein